MLKTSTSGIKPINLCVHVRQSTNWAIEHGHQAYRYLLVAWANEQPQRHHCEHAENGYHGAEKWTCETPMFHQSMALSVQLLLQPRTHKRRTFWQACTVQTYHVETYDGENRCLLSYYDCRQTVINNQALLWSLMTRNSSIWQVSTANIYDKFDPSKQYNTMNNHFICSQTMDIITFLQAERNKCWILKIYEYHARIYCPLRVLMTTFKIMKEATSAS